MSENRDDGSKIKEGPESRYDDELLSANWNPVINMLAWSCGKTMEDMSRTPNASMTDSEIDAFLQRIYMLGA